MHGNVCSRRSKLKRSAVGSEKREDMALDCTEQSGASRLPQRSKGTSEMQLRLTQVVDALAELYNLLEQYAPLWYTREHHEKAESALRLTTKS
jgi:hypothetical protein